MTSQEEQHVNGLQEMDESERLSGVRRRSQSMPEAESGLRRSVGTSPTLRSKSETYPGETMRLPTTALGDKMFTANVTRDGAWLTSVDEREVPDHLCVRIPPAWTDVAVNLDPISPCLVTGRDVAGRRQRLYSATWSASAKSSKFERVRSLLVEHDDVRTQIEEVINDESADAKTREAATVALLVFDTGIRPGSTFDTLAKVQAYGATTLQLRHVKSCARGVRLQFVGKKGVKQNVLVTNPYLVDVMRRRKATTTAYTTPLFRITASTLNAFIATLGSGNYTAKDLRTALGTKIAMDLIGDRKRLPASQSKRKVFLNDCLDKVAKQLGNTRAISRSSYVDPIIVESFYAH